MGALRRWVQLPTWMPLGNHSTRSIRASALTVALASQQTIHSECTGSQTTFAFNTHISDGRYSKSTPPGLPIGSAIPTGIRRTATAWSFTSNSSATLTTTTRLAGHSLANSAAFSAFTRQSYTACFVGTTRLYRLTPTVGFARLTSRCCLSAHCCYCYLSIGAVHRLWPNL